MKYIGIDMSKDTFHAAFTEDLVEVFSNNKTGIKKFISKMKRLKANFDDTKIGVESTGAYHIFLCAQMTENGWSIYEMNPLLTNRFIKCQLRVVKNDTRDAIAIREALVAGVGYKYSDSQELIAIKTIAQERESLVKLQSKCKNLVHSQEIKQKAIHTKLETDFEPILDVLKTEISKREKLLSETNSEAQILLQSIPGIGKSSSAYLAAFIGDINRFSNPKKLVAYLGLDCRVHQSGTSINGKGYISKRGSKILRGILFNSTLISRQKIPELRSFYEKKVNEGHHYFSAMCATERKLVHLIYAVWKRGTPYELRN